jgi:hypothetical protein
MLAGPVPISVDSFAFPGSRPGTASFDFFVLCWATAATAVPVARHGPVLLRAPAPRAGPCLCRGRWEGCPDRVQELAAAVMCGSKRRLTVRRFTSGLPIVTQSRIRECCRRRFNFTGEARGWSIVNLGILVSYKCKARMNVCAMVRSASLWLVVVRRRYAVRTGIVEAKC